MTRRFPNGPTSLAQPFSFAVWMYSFFPLFRRVGGLQSTPHQTQTFLSHWDGGGNSAKKKLLKLGFQTHRMFQMRRTLDCGGAQNKLKPHGNNPRIRKYVNCTSPSHTKTKTQMNSVPEMRYIVMNCVAQKFQACPPSPFIPAEVETRGSGRGRRSVGGAGGTPCPGVFRGGNVVGARQLPPLCPMREKKPREGGWVDTPQPTPLILLELGVQASGWLLVSRGRTAEGCQEPTQNYKRN